MRQRTAAVWMATVLLAASFAVALTVATEEEEVAKVAKPIPEEANKRANPVTADRSSLAEGSELFHSQCTMCHGSEGRGDGDLVGRLKLRVPDFTDAEWQTEWSDGAMFYVLSEGHGRMPAQKQRDGAQRFDETTRWHLVNYIRSLGP